MNRENVKRGVVMVCLALLLGFTLGSAAYPPVVVYQKPTFTTGVVVCHPVTGANASTEIVRLPVGPETDKPLNDSELRRFAQDVCPAVPVVANATGLKGDAR